MTYYEKELSEMTIEKMADLYERLSDGCLDCEIFEFCEKLFPVEKMSRSHKDCRYAWLNWFNSEVNSSEKANSSTYAFDEDDLNDLIGGGFNI